MAPAAGERHLAEHRAAVADRDRHLRGRGVDREHQHVSRSPRASSSTSAASASPRVAHDATGGLERRRRGRRRRHPASSSTSRRSAGSSALDAVAPFDDRDRVDRRRARRSPRSCSSWRWSRRYTSTCTSGSAAVVLAHERERRAHHRLRVMPSARAMPFANTVLPDAELAVEHDDVAGAQDRADARRQRERLRRRVRRARQAWSSSPQRRRARASRATKSARACASAAPPFRSTADGWSVGDEHRAVTERELAGRAAS